MIRKFAFAAAALAALAVASHPAQAGSGKRVDKRVAATAIVTSAGATTAYFAMNDWRWKWNSGSVPSWAAWGISTVGCMTVAPMVASIVVERPLTNREAHVLAGSCVVPIIGGWLVNAAYNAHPEWEPQPKAVKAKGAKKKAAKKK